MICKLSISNVRSEWKVLIIDCRLNFFSYWLINIELKEWKVCAHTFQIDIFICLVVQCMRMQTQCNVIIIIVVIVIDGAAQAAQHDTFTLPVVS